MAGAVTHRAPARMRESSYPTLEHGPPEKSVISYTAEEFLEEKLLNLLEPEEQAHTFLTFEQVIESEDTREVFTGTYEYFTNPHSVITPKHLKTLYQFL